MCKAKKKLDRGIHCYLGGRSRFIFNSHLLIYTNKKKRKYWLEKAKEDWKIPAGNDVKIKSLQKKTFENVFAIMYIPKWQSQTIQVAMAKRNNDLHDILHKAWKKSYVQSEKKYKEQKFENARNIIHGYKGILLKKWTRMQWTQGE